MSKLEPLPSLNEQQVIIAHQLWAFISTGTQWAELLEEYTLEIIEFISTQYAYNREASVISDSNNRRGRSAGLEEPFPSEFTTDRTALRQAARTLLFYINQTPLPQHQLFQDWILDTDSIGKEITRRKRARQEERDRRVQTQT